MATRWGHRDRLQALVEGVRTDRPPVALWRHFYKDEDDLDRFVEAMVFWQKTYDWDFLKINPRASYHYEPWGVRMRPSPDRATKPERIGFPIASAADWEKIIQRSPKESQFDFQLRAVRRIRRAVSPEVPVIMTVFNPISVAGDMVTDEQILLDSMRDQPAQLVNALSAITETFVNLVHEFRNAGADGIFFATTQWASRDRITLDRLKQFVLSDDKRVWDAAGDDAFNVLHVCENNVHLEAYKDFKANIVNWDVSLPNPSLSEGHRLIERPVMGGIDHNSSLVKQNPDEIRKTVRRLIDDYREIPYALGPGCAIPVTVGHENVRAVREAVD